MASTAKRSRFGCRNCKLRKVKCDEGKPGCRKCMLYGVLCTFASNMPDLQPVTAGSSSLNVPRPLVNAIWMPNASAFRQLNQRCQDFITRYYGRSLATPGDLDMSHVNRKLLELSFSYPFLMHASLAVALTYGRHLNGSGSRTLEECYHWSQSTSLLNKRLQEPIREEDKDPIWGTTAALVILTFSSPEAHDPEQSWPLNSRASSELDWLRMSEGKMSLWPILDPMRPNSLFRVMASTFADMHSPLPDRGINGIPKTLTAVLNLEDSSTPESNPYFHAAHAVSRIVDLEDSEVKTGHAQFFMRTVHGPFKELLIQKDPCALLLLYLWYHKASRSIWWIELRARVECPSICLYLQRYHPNSPVLAFLDIILE